MTAEARDSILKIVAAIAGGVTVYVSGHYQGSAAAEETHQAKTEGVSEASQAVRKALQDELLPLHNDINRLTSAVDTLWTSRKNTEARLAALELPASATAADDWRQLPVQASYARRQR